MAGFTDKPFRQLVKSFGCDLVYTEMISARGVFEDYKENGFSKSLKLAEFEDAERPILVQIFGREPKIMAEAAKIICNKFDPDGIDINMGCPAPKIVKNSYGSVLMNEPELAGQIVKVVKRASGNRLVTVKTRLGWKDSKGVGDFILTLEDAGADLIALHCRTKMQGFSGDPDWDAVRQIKKNIKIPILVNGGIKKWQDVDKCLSASDGDGVLIGQASLGRPWIFQEIREARSITLSYDEITKICLQHVCLHRENCGNFVELKKHLLHYYKGIANCAKVREKICQCNDVKEFLSIVGTFGSQ